MPEDIQHALGRIEAKLDMLLGLESRVTSLEGWRWRAVGAVSVVGLIAGFIASMLVQHG